MIDYKVVKKIQMDCPLCDTFHEIEQRCRITDTIIKGEKISYEETYYFCRNSDIDENEFSTGEMENQNLLNARNAYRSSHDLLTSVEIVEIRKMYDLSQVDFAKLLGWGEATISRYESKAIQDEAYDNMMRIIRDNPLTALEFLDKNHGKFAPERYNKIKEKILENIHDDGREYLQRQSLESKYVDYSVPCDENGFKLLDIDKLELIISYFAKRVEFLYKVKLMKMLWYADSLSFRNFGKSMTGLVYCHDTMGALPIGHYEIVGLENINIQEEEGFEYTKYHFLPNDKIEESLLSEDEKNTLDTVIKKFISYNSEEIVEYMHKESAYTRTKDKEIIPFSLAKEIRGF